MIFIQSDFLNLIKGYSLYNDAGYLKQILKMFYSYYIFLLSGVQLLGTSCNCFGQGEMVTCSATLVIFIQWIWHFKLATSNLFLTCHIRILYRS